jgi:hypothetical protein
MSGHVPKWSRHWGIGAIPSALLGAGHSGRSPVACSERWRQSLLFRGGSARTEDEVLGELGVMIEGMGLSANQEPNRAAGIAWAVSPGATVDSREPKGPAKEGALGSVWAENPEASEDSRDPKSPGKEGTSEEKTVGEAAIGPIPADSSRTARGSWESESPEKEEMAEASVVVGAIRAGSPGIAGDRRDSRIRTFGGPLCNTILLGDIVTQLCRDIVTLSSSHRIATSGSGRLLKPVGRLDSAIKRGFILPKRSSSCKKSSLLMWLDGSDRLCLRSVCLTSLAFETSSSLVSIRIVLSTLTITTSQRSWAGQRIAAMRALFRSCIAVTRALFCSCIAATCAALFS